VTVQLISIWCIYYLGDLNELSRRVHRKLAEAEQRGDLFAATNLRTTLSSLVWLRDDNVSEARRQAALAKQQWSQRGFHIQHYHALFADVQTDLYLGHGAAALLRIEQAWRPATRALLMQIQYVRISMLHLRARSCIAAGDDDPESAKPLLRRAACDARAIEAERMSWSNPIAKCVRAGIALVQGNPAAGAAWLRQAVAEFGEADMTLFGTAARKRLGEIIGGDEGASLITEADRWYARQGVKNPAQLTTMLIPGRAISASTVKLCRIAGADV
jgi:hypothetical protein